MLRLFLTIAIGLAATVFLLNIADADDQMPLYGRLKVELRLPQTTIPPGNYVEIGFDDNDAWVLSDKYEGNIRVPKSSVDLIDRKMYSPRLNGTVKFANAVLLAFPDVVRYPNTLEQYPAPSSDNNVNPDTKITVFGREGNDYLASIGYHQFRLPISTVNITYPDDPDSGKLEPVPLLSERNRQSTASGAVFTGPIIIIAVVVIGSLFVFWFIVGLRPKKQKVVHLTEIQRAAIEREKAILNRFPPNKIYRVPSWAASSVACLPIEKYPCFDENIDFIWNQLLESYPEAPRTEPERLEREEKFWQEYANRFSVISSSGQLFLKPKHEITEYFQTYEKLVFREFYAATGIINETIMKEWVEHISGKENAHRMKTRGDGRSLSNTQKRQAVEKAEDAYDRFEREIFVAHFQKWGEWFFSNIQDAFNKTIKPPTNFGPETAITPATPSTQDALTYKPNA